MVKSERLIRIKKGFYTFSRNENVIGFAFRPFYYGMEYALTLRKIWTQQANPVIMTTSKANAGLREVMKSKVIVHRIDSHAYFGFEYLSFSGLFVPVSLPEKILLDFMYFQADIDPSTRQTLIKESNRKVLRNFADRMGSRYSTQIDSLIDNFMEK